MASVSIPNFEEQVLQAMSQLAMDERNARYTTTDDEIAEAGNELFGNHWSGNWTTYRYPKINAALGRLRRKDLVERTASGDRDWGFWALTTTGIDLVGLSDLALVVPRDGNLMEAFEGSSI